MWDVDYDQIEKLFLRDRMGEVLNQLAPMERTVLYYRVWEGYTFKELSKKIKRCPQQISQIEKKAYRKLRSPDYRRYLTDFVPDFHNQSLKNKSNDEKSFVSIFDMHPAFREVNLFARKLPLIRKENKRLEQLKHKREEKEKLKETIRLARMKENELKKLREIQLREAQKKAKENRDRWLLEEMERASASFNNWYEKQFGSRIP